LIGLMTTFDAPVLAQDTTPAATAKVFRIGVLRTSDAPPPPQLTVLQYELQRLGYVEGRNLKTDFRWVSGDTAQFTRYAAELLALRPDVIVAETTPGAIAVRRATSMIPIVLAYVSDPVGTGLVASLRRLGGNVTGSTDLGTELVVKLVDFLHELLPASTHLGV